MFVMDMWTVLMVWMNRCAVTCVHFIIATTKKIINVTYLATAPTAPVPLSIINVYIVVAAFPTQRYVIATQTARIKQMKVICYVLIIPVMT
jgi:hypothetical protein